MSGAINHRKRSHRSEQYKRGAYTTARKPVYRAANTSRGNGVIQRLFNTFRRSLPKSTENTERREVEE